MSQPNSRGGNEAGASGSCITKGDPRNKSTGALGLPPPFDPTAEIEAELRDHLASAADRLQQQGIPPAVAQQKAQESFGDLAAITRRCYWIKQGDAVMFRWAVIGLLSILCVAMGITVLGSWRSQARMAEQMSALAEQLKTLAERQVTSSAVPAPLEISGKAFLRTAEKAAANIEVLICRADDGEIIRRVVTGADGSFLSGPLAAGDYSVIGKQSKSDPTPRLGFQSAPIYLYPGTQTQRIALDVAHPKGQLAVSLSQPLPKLEVEGKYVIDSRLYLRMEPIALRWRRWTAKSAMPDHWPLFIYSPEMGLDAEAAKNFRGDLFSYTVLGNQDLAPNAAVNFPGDGERLTAGPYRVAAAVVTDIKPYGESDEVLSPYQRSNEDARMRWLSMPWVMGGYMGSLWQFKLLREPDSRADRPFPTTYSNFPAASTTVDLHDGKLTRLAIEIPPDTASRIQTFVDTFTNANDFATAVKKDRPFIREVKISVLGMEELTEAKRDPAATGSVQ